LNEIAANRGGQDGATVFALSDFASLQTNAYRLSVLRPRRLRSAPCAGEGEIAAICAPTPGLLGYVGAGMPAQHSWQVTGGQAARIRGPAFGIGIQPHPFDIHDHVTSVATQWKRQDLRGIRETRETQSFVAAQAARRTVDRAEHVAQRHAENTAAVADGAARQFGAERGAMPESESRLAREVAAATGCNFTQSLALLKQHGWSIAAAVQAFTLSGNPGMQNPPRVPDVGTRLVPTGEVERWHPHMAEHAPAVGAGKTRCQFTRQAMPSYRVQRELDPLRRPPPAYKLEGHGDFDGVSDNAGAAGGGQNEGGGTGAGAD
jgi:hypothetical protein